MEKEVKNERKIWRILNSRRGYRDMRYVIIIVIFLLNGCITSPKYNVADIWEKRKQDIISKDLAQKRKYITQHPNLSKEIQDNILTYKVSEGMTKDDVIATLGEPHAERQAVYMNKPCDIWYYGLSGNNFETFSCFTLYFTDNSLVHSIQNKIEGLTGIDNMQKARMTAKEQQEFDIRQEYVNQHPNISEQIKKCILNKQITIGMNKKDVLVSWGKPLHINKTVFKNSVHEQWVYSNRYLYFINDRLDSYQTEEH